jgi:hypothetical protein
VTRVWETWCRLSWCHYKPTCNIIRSCIISYPIHVMLFFRNDWHLDTILYVTSIDGVTKLNKWISTDTLQLSCCLKIIDEIIINSPSDKPTCCWWLPVLGSGPDSSCRQCNYPKFFGIYKIVWNLLAVYTFQEITNNKQ